VYPSASRVCHSPLSDMKEKLISNGLETIDVAGHDSTIGYSRYVDKPVKESSAIVRLLQDAGALVHLKTSVPTGLLAIETSSAVFGRTTNPYNPGHSAGASTGGGAALLACGGSKIEVGTDLAGSVRIPAHFCGVWSLKGSAGRFPIWGNRSPMMGLESLPILAAPMANSLDDLCEFWKRVLDMKPWQYDHTVMPLLRADLISGVHTIHVVCSSPMAACESARRGQTIEVGCHLG